MQKAIALTLFQIALMSYEQDVWDRPQKSENQRQYGQQKGFWKNSAKVSDLNFGKNLMYEECEKNKDTGIATEGG